MPVINSLSKKENINLRNSNAESGSAFFILSEDFSIKYANSHFDENYVCEFSKESIFNIPFFLTIEDFRETVSLFFRSEEGSIGTLNFNKGNDKYQIQFSFSRGELNCRLSLYSEIEKQISKITKEAYEKYTSVLNNFIDIYYVTEKYPDGIFYLKEISPSVEHIAGYKPEQIIGLPSSSFYESETDYNVIAEKLNEDLIVQDYPLELIKADGNKIWSSLTARQVVENGITRVYGVIRDISGLKSVDTILKLKEEFYKSLMANSLEITCVLNPDGIIEFISPAVFRVMGYTPEELKGRNVFEFIHPGHHEKALTAFNTRVEEGGQGDCIDWKFINSNGEYRYLSVMINMLEGSNGESVINAVDVTDRYIAEKKLISSNFRFSIINEINKIVLTSSSVNKIAERTIKLVVQSLAHCDIGTVALIRENDAEFIANIGSSTGSFIRKGSRIPLEYMSSGSILLDGGFYYDENIRENPHPSFTDLQLLKEGILSYVIFPLVAQDKTIGFISLGSKQEGFFSDETIEFIDGIIIEIALGIQDAYLKDCLKLSEMQNSAIIAGIPDLIFRLDKKGDILDIISNDSNVPFGLPDMRRGVNIKELFPSNIGKEYLKNVGRAIITGETQMFVHECPVRAEKSFVELRFSPTDNNEVIVLMRDVTQIENYKKELEIRNRAIESSPDGIIIINADTEKVLYMNTASFRITGYKENDLNQLAFSFTKNSNNNLLSFLCTSQPLLKIKKKLTETGVCKSENRSKKKSGSYYWNEVTIHAMKSKGEISHFVVSVRDTTKFKNLDQRMLNRVIHAQERERKRIAADLHDGLGQTLTAVNMYYQALRELDPVKNKEEWNLFADTTGELITRSMAETRLISHNLMPNSLSKFGLSQSITELINRHNLLKLELSIIFENNIENIRYNSTIEISIFRIVQEIINNAIKHSGGSVLEIRLFEKNKYLFLEANDNGNGFNPKKTLKDNGLGLNTLRARVKSLNGEINIKTIRGKGTRLKLKVPALNK